MSNIIDGIPYGMGYEPTKEWGKNIQWWNDETKEWQPSASFCQTHVDVEIKNGGHYRRPLPIISQHPGAIPLEPGEELKFLDWVLTSEGKKRYLRYENCFGVLSDDPYGNNAWEKDGSPFKKTQEKIIARLPKVEQKEPEKAKEEKVEEETVDCITIVERREGLVKRMTVPEAARIYLENPSVQAEVERQRKEKEIKVGDWFRWRSAYDKCRSLAEHLIHGTAGSYSTNGCTKIHDLAFIAMLENGVGK